jgi:ribosomal protein L13E
VGDNGRGESAVKRKLRRWPTMRLRKVLLPLEVDDGVREGRGETVAQWEAAGMEWVESALGGFMVWRQRGATSTIIED